LNISWSQVGVPGQVKVMEVEVVVVVVVV